MHSLRSQSNRGQSLHLLRYCQSSHNDQSTKSRALTRRHTLQASVALPGVAMAAAQDKTDPVQVALVGTGTFAKVAWAPLLRYAVHCAVRCYLTLTVVRFGLFTEFSSVMRSQHMLAGALQTTAPLRTCGADQRTRPPALWRTSRSSCALTASLWTVLLAESSWQTHAQISPHLPQYTASSLPCQTFECRGTLQRQGCRGVKGSWFQTDAAR